MSQKLGEKTSKNSESEKCLVLDFEKLLKALSRFLRVQLQVQIGTH